MMRIIDYLEFERVRAHKRIAENRLGIVVQAASAQGAAREISHIQPRKRQPAKMSNGMESQLEGYYF